MGEGASRSLPKWTIGPKQKQVMATEVCLNIFVSHNLLKMEEMVVMLLSIDGRSNFSELMIKMIKQ